jgi:hypothetical protein
VPPMFQEKDLTAIFGMFDITGSGKISQAQVRPTVPPLAACASHPAYPARAQLVPTALPWANCRVGATESDDSLCGRTCARSSWP